MVKITTATTTNMKNSSYYSLLILMLVVVFTNADRSLMSILVEDIKADLNITDSQIGFIFGTAVSVFYGLFSVVLGHLADSWNRRKLIKIGIGACGILIFFTSWAKSFLSLAILRVGVGVGESSSAPAAVSMISDYFPSKYRATALSIFASGTNIGVGVGIFAGGAILQSWMNVFPDTSHAPFGLKGWQVALIALAFFGCLLVLLMDTLKEPPRGQYDGLLSTHEGNPFRQSWLVFKTVLPIVSMYELSKKGGYRSIAYNLLVACCIVISCYFLVMITESTVQWVATSFGFYCVFCWAQSLKRNDPVAFGMIFRCKSLMFLVLGLSLMAFVVSAMATWVAPFFQRVHLMVPGDVGLYVGLASVFGGLIGTILGGLLADHCKRYSIRAPIYVILISILAVGPILYTMFNAVSHHMSIIFYALYILTVSLWYGVAPALVVDLVIPKIRGVVSAFYILSITFLGFAMGPYAVGLISDYLVVENGDSALSLKIALQSSLLILPFAFLFVLLAAYYFKSDFLSRDKRALLLGEEMENK